MKNKDLFSITISVIAILLLLTTPINQKIKDIGNQITGYTSGPSISSAGGSGGGSSSSSSSGPTKTTSQNQIQEPETEDSSTGSDEKVEATETDEAIEKANKVSETLKSPGISSVVTALKFSKTEQAIIEELALDYIKSTSAQTESSETKSSEKEIPQEVRLSIPEQNTELIIGATEGIYPYINLHIKP